MAFARATDAVWRAQIFRGHRLPHRQAIGTAANVFELDDADLPREGWCFVPNDHLVAVDVMLAQKIGLETDERGALAMANNFTPR
jgi:hypothetical protein